MKQLRVLARSLVQRVYHRKSRGVTPYFVDGFDARMQAAEWQVSRCAGKCMLEIGCGKDLHTSLVAAIKFRKQVISHDIAMNADLELINYTAKRLGHEPAITSLQDLNQLGITYVVAKGIGDIAGYDDIVSTAVFEHVPAEGLDDIFRVSRRQNVRTITANIDFKDHWSYLEQVKQDAFYYVSDLYWNLINNARMYQNRLRLSDIEKIACQYGYQRSEIELSRFQQPVDSKSLNHRFQNHTLEDLQTAQCLIKWDLP